MPRATTTERSRAMKRTNNGIIIPDVPIMAGGNLPNTVKGVSAGGSIAEKYVLQSFEPTLASYNPAACIIFEQKGIGEYIDQSDKTKGWGLSKITANEITTLNRIFSNKTTVIDTKGICGTVGQSYEFTEFPQIEQLNVSSFLDKEFINCSSLTSIIFPKTLVNYSDKVCMNCTALASVIIKATAAKYNGTETSQIWAKSPFIDCTSLSGIIVDNGVEEIEQSMLNNGRHDNVINITIAGSVTKIGYYAFGSNTSDVVINAVNPPEFNSADCNVRSIKVPAESVDAYKTAWSNLAARISAI